MGWRAGNSSLIALLVLAPLLASAGSKNGFDLSSASVPESEIFQGGPPRDGIPALNQPRVLRAGEADWAKWADEEVVIGVVVQGRARAYPLSVLVWHELVYDRIAGRPLLVSYCPLCGTGMVFDSRVAGVAHEFGVSGLLYQSDMLLFDRATESLWSQVRSQAISGSSRGKRLTLLRSEMMSWKEWKQSHPATTVLSPKTGYDRAYGSQPYGDYATSRRLMFPVSFDRRLHAKTPTLGIRLVGGAARAYPATEVANAGGRVEEVLSGHSVVIRYDTEKKKFQVQASPELEVVEGYWFAWMAFHPESSVFSASKDLP